MENQEETLKEIAKNVLENKSILDEVLKNQAAILENQHGILENQSAILENQDDIIAKIGK